MGTWKMGKETCRSHNVLMAWKRDPWGMDWENPIDQNIATAAVCLRTAFFLDAMKEIYNKDASPSIHLKKIFII